MVDFIIGFICGSWITIMIAGYLWDREIDKMKGKNTNEKNRRR